ncbi:unnamed protein product [Linum trigynum]|uniref:GAG-pre-integrase domain-containing protein n=1 Tax=Linum trigynum TaxID=586398 RepID=A0AAV2CET3_9ROSI
MSVSQLKTSGNYVVFGPKNVKVIRSLQPTSDLIMQGQKLEPVYVMSVEAAYVDKTRRNETASLWYARLGHVGYQKLRVMMKKSMLKGLPQLDIRDDIVCAGCQYGKAHQLPYEDSKFKSNVIHFRVFGCVCYVFVANHARSKFDKKQSGAFLWVMPIKRKDGDVVTQQQETVMCHATWCLTKYPPGGHQKQSYFQTQRRWRRGC